jgi:hypothetical protein
VKTYTFPERRPKISGPWDNEPDKAQWIDEATGLDCLIVRNHFGGLCGYVGVQPGHEWHGVEYGVPDVDVHGGLTFADLCQEGAEDGPGVCHIPEPGRPANVWWLGFDCGHYMDIQPAMIEEDFPYGDMWGLKPAYRTFEYVQQECAGLAKQVAERE